MNIIARKMYSFIRFYISRLSKKDPSKPFVFIAIGDSTVEGVGATHPSRSYTGIIYAMIKEQFPKATYHNFGKFGASSKSVIEEQLDKAIALNPDLVTISVGANDINEKVLPPKFGRNLRTIIETIQRETHAKIVINNLPDFTKSAAISLMHRKLSGLVISKYNKAIEKVTSQYDVFFIDLYKHSRVYAKHYPELIAEDKFHPSDFGYALWANTIMNAIANHIFPEAGRKL
jgi:acyl-CoA thioesterase-1